jgi:Skp family chaperone for outer membrane proteins
MKNLALAFLVLLAGFAFSAAQAGDKNSREVGPIRSSSAFAEVSLRRAELEAEIESYMGDYTEQNPKLVDARTELNFLLSDLDRIYAVPPADMGKLTEALGKMIVRRAALETEAERLLRTYSKDHPNVKRAKRKAAIFEKAIREILG